MNGKTGLAIDLGGTKISAALFDANGIASPVEIRYLEQRSGSQVGELILELAAHFLGLAAERRLVLERVGVAVPGIYYSKTGKAWAPNIPGWEDYPLYSELTEVLEPKGIALSIDSDRACYILGEAWKGAARGCQNAIFLAVGTGIGNDGIHSDVLLAIYDPTVDSLIVRTYGSDASESGLTISLKPDGDMIVAGTTTGFGSVDGNIWLLELDSSGGEVSYSVIQHTGADAAYSNVQVESGTILCGKTTVAGQNLGFAISTTEQFDTLWTREFAESSAEVQLRGVTVSRSGNLIAAGWSGASWNTRQCWLVAIESDGTVDWNWLHGTPGSGFYGITDVPAGGYLAFGQLVIGNSRRAYAARIFLSKLTGLVIDNSDGTPVEGAKVSTSEQNIFTTTDSEGRFILAASNGIHDVFIERHCFSKDTLESINIAPDEIRDINVSLLSPGLATSLSSINVFVPNQETIAVPLTISNPADGYL